MLNSGRRTFRAIILLTLFAPAYVIAGSSWSASSPGAQLPQDIRIMQRIVSTALGEVESPELPDALKLEAGAAGVRGAYVYDAGDSGATVWTFAGAGDGVFSIGSRDVTGFYMQGYGYLFTLKWRVRPRGLSFLYSEETDERVSELNVLVDEARRAAAAPQPDEARAAGEAERALEQEREKLEQRQAAWEQWSAEYRDLLAEALRHVVAQYGSTLNRAAPEESITFIADFGGGESETVTVTARRGQLTGTNRDENLAAVQMNKGQAEVSGNMGMELKIMAEIIDTSLQAEGSDEVWFATYDQARYLRGDSSYQYVPGYGVLFRKSARLNLAYQVVSDVAPSGSEPAATAPSLRRRMKESTQEQLAVYAEHLTDLKQKTAEVMATYGPTLTEMDADAWVGVYYEVGPAAGLLEGGITNFLVQARMADIRQAAGETDGVAWLLEQLVTNEKQD